MVKISNQPNINGIKNVSEDMEYGSRLIAREGKLFAGLHITRASGMVLGALLALLIIVIIPTIAILCGL